MSNTVADESAIPLSPNAEVKDRIEAVTADGDVKTAAPFALVIDDEIAVCRLVAEVLAGLGVESSTYQSAKLAIASLDKRRSEIIFLDVALEQGDAIDVIKSLSEKHYRGVVQLMSGGRLPLLEAIQRIGARYGLLLSRPLQKPFQAEAIREVIVSLGLARDMAPPTI
jgi:DNA-binding NtrC family response regulator